MCNEKEQPLWKKIIEWSFVAVILSLCGLQFAEVQGELDYLNQWLAHEQRVDEQMSEVLSILRDHHPTVEELESLDAEGTVD